MRISKSGNVKTREKMKIFKEESMKNLPSNKKNQRSKHRTNVEEKNEI